MSWLTDALHSLVNGFAGIPAPAHDEAKPLSGALAVLNQAVNSVGSTASGLAATTVDGYLNQHVGPLGTEVANLALEALITEAQKRLTPTSVTPPTA